MKKIILLLLTLALVFAVGCSKKDDTVNETSANAVTEKVADTSGETDSGTEKSSETETETVTETETETETEDITLGEIFDMSDLPPAETTEDAGESAEDQSEPEWPFDSVDDAEPIELPIIRIA